MNRIRWVLPILALTPLVGCHSSSSPDETVAVVNGQSIGRSALALDLAARHLTFDAASASLRAVLLDQLVSRSLLARQAQTDGLDQDPRYAATVARLKETVLVGLLLNKWRRSVPPPQQGDVQAFIEANPQIFADRMIYIFDEFRTDAKGLNEADLRELRSMDAIADYLRQRDHPFRRGSASLDTLNTGLLPAQEIAHLSPGEPLLSGDGTTLVVRSVIRSSPAPIVGEDGERLAGQLWRNAVARTMVQQKLKALRATASISYPSTSTSSN